MHFRLAPPGPGFSDERFRAVQCVEPILDPARPQLAVGEEQHVEILTEGETENVEGSKSFTYQAAAVFSASRFDFKPARIDRAVRQINGKSLLGHNAEQCFCRTGLRCLVTDQPARVEGSDA